MSPGDAFIGWENRGLKQSMTFTNRVETFTLSIFSYVAYDDHFFFILFGNFGNFGNFESIT